MIPYTEVFKYITYDSASDSLHHLQNSGNQTISRPKISGHQGGNLGSHMPVNQRHPILRKGLLSISRLRFFYSLQAASHNDWSYNPPTIQSPHLPLISAMNLWIGDISSTALFVFRIPIPNVAISTPSFSNLPRSWAARNSACCRLCSARFRVVSASKVVLDERRQLLRVRGVGLSERIVTVSGSFLLWDEFSLWCWSLKEGGRYTHSLDFEFGSQGLRSLAGIVFSMPAISDLVFFPSPILPCRLLSPVLSNKQPPKWSKARVPVKVRISQYRYCT